MSINPLVRIKWRASLVPAAAVIPAPLAYIKIVAVKTFEVDSCPTQADTVDPDQSVVGRFVRILVETQMVRSGAKPLASCPSTGAFKYGARPFSFTLNKLECFKQAHEYMAENNLAWNNGI